MPETYHDIVSLPVRITDINYGNHVGNDSVVSLLHEARVLWFAKYGFTEFNAGNNSLIMGHLAVEYKQQIIYPNFLHITIAIDNISSSSFEIFYEMKNEKNETMVKAYTGMVCYDYKGNKVAKMTDQLRNMLLKIA